MRYAQRVIRQWNLPGLLLIPTIVTLTLVVRAPAATASVGEISQPARPPIPPPLSETSAYVKQFEETSYYLEDVAFVTTDVGWAVGQVHWDATQKRYAGTIVKTVDGGETWVLQDAGVNEPLRGLCFLDGEQGWAVGANGTILHTTDSGSHWSKQAVDTTDDFRGVVFVDANSGWATSIRDIHRNERTGEADDWQGSIWHTSDGGQSWVRQTLPESASLLNGVDFADERHGFAVGIKRVGQDGSGPQHSAVVYRTIDGGQTWAEAYDPGLAMTLTGIEFVDAVNGWAVGFITNSGIEGGSVIHTSDGGETWERQDAGGFGRLLRAVQFIDQERGYIVGADYMGAWGPPVYRTVDGGKTWTEIRMARHENDGLSGVAVVGDRVIAVGEHDYVIKSDRAWDSCEPATSGPQTPPPSPCYDCDCLFRQFFVNIHYKLQDVFFLDEMQGWVVGSRSFGVSISGQVVLHTADGGATWETQYEDASPLDSLWSIYRLNGVYFSDAQTGWAVGRAQSFVGDQRWDFRGAILHTTDGGKRWEQQGMELYADWALEFFAVQFLDSQNGWALAESRFPERTVFVAHTTDGGNRWDWVDTGVEGSLGVGYEYVMGDLDFTDEQHGLVVGGLGKVIRTDDGGGHWAQQEVDCGYPSCNYALYALDMINGQRGGIAGQEYFSTSNGGSRWSMQDLPFSVDLFDIKFVDTEQGWMVGDHGVVLHTEDGGDSWSLAQSGLLDPLFGVCFVNPQHGWFIGDYGTIVSYASSQVPTGTVPLLSPIWRPGQSVSSGLNAGIQIIYVP